MHGETKQITENVILKDKTKEKPIRAKDWIKKFLKEDKISDGSDRKSWSIKWFKKVPKEYYQNKKKFAWTKGKHYTALINAVLEQLIKDNQLGDMIEKTANKEKVTMSQLKTILPKSTLDGIKSNSQDVLDAFKYIGKNEIKKSEGFKKFNAQEIDGLVATWNKYNLKESDGIVNKSTHLMQKFEKYNLGSIGREVNAVKIKQTHEKTNNWFGSKKLNNDQKLKIIHKKAENGNVLAQRLLVINDCLSEKEGKNLTFDRLINVDANVNTLLRLNEYKTKIKDGDFSEAEEIVGRSFSTEEKDELIGIVQSDDFDMMLEGIISYYEEIGIDVEISFNIKLPESFKNRMVDITTDSNSLSGLGAETFEKNNDPEFDAYMESPQDNLVENTYIGNSSVKFTETDEVLEGITTDISKQQELKDLCMSDNFEKQKNDNLIYTSLNKNKQLVIDNLASKIDKSKNDVEGKTQEVFKKGRVNMLLGSIKQQLKTPEGYLGDFTLNEDGIDFDRTESGDNMIHINGSIDGTPIKLIADEQGNLKINQPLHMDASKVIHVSDKDHYVTLPWVHLPGKEEYKNMLGELNCKEIVEQSNSSKEYIEKLTKSLTFPDSKGKYSSPLAMMSVTKHIKNNQFMTEFLEAMHYDTNREEMEFSKENNTKQYFNFWRPLFNTLNLSSDEERMQLMKGITKIKNHVENPRNKQDLFNGTYIQKKERLSHQTVEEQKMSHYRLPSELMQHYFAKEEQYNESMHTTDDEMLKGENSYISLLSIFTKPYSLGKDMKEKVFDTARIYNFANSLDKSYADQKLALGRDFFGGIEGEDADVFGVDDMKMNYKKVSGEIREKEIQKEKEQADDALTASIENIYQHKNNTNHFIT